MRLCRASSTGRATVALLFCAGLAGCLSGGGDVGRGGGEDEGIAEKPSALPAFESLRLYSPDSPLNHKIARDAKIDSGSAGYVDLVVRSAEEGGFVIELKQYTTTVFFADSTTPTTDVYLTCGPEWAGVEMLKDVPIPPFAEPTIDSDGADNPIPFGGCGSDADQDNQMVILDPASRCEFDFFQARKENGRWVASFANSISMDGDGIYEGGLSARGSGFTTLAGLIWPDELEKGVITHALIFSYPHAKAGGPVAPATESDGVSTNPHALPEGARLRLDPAIDLDSLDLSGAERTIATALQLYGMFLVDDGSFGVSIEAVNPASVRGNPFEGLLPDEDYPSLSHIPLEGLQVLELGPQDPAADENGGLYPSGCGSME